MIKKTRHPSNRGERLAIKAKKKVHSNASPVYKLLKDREDIIKQNISLDIVQPTEGGASPKKER